MNVDPKWRKWWKKNENFFVFDFSFFLFIYKFDKKKTTTNI